MASIQASAAARGVEAQLLVLAGAQRGEHERAVGAWQAEWPALSEAFRLAGGAVGRAGDALAGLRVDEARMRKNLELDRGLALAEHVKMVLAERVGRERAHELVGSAAARVTTGGGSFREELLADAEVASSLTTDEVDAALAPDRYLGSTAAFIDRALAAYHERSLGSE